MMYDYLLNKTFSVSRWLCMPNLDKRPPDCNFEANPAIPKTMSIPPILVDRVLRTINLSGTGYSFCGQESH